MEIALIILVAPLGLFLLWTTGFFALEAIPHRDMNDLDPQLCYRVLTQYEENGQWYMVASNNHYDKEKNMARIFKMADQKLDLEGNEWIRIEKIGKLPTKILFVKYPPVIERWVC